MPLRIDSQLAVPGGHPRGLTFDGDALWVACEDPLELLRISPRDSKVLARVALPIVTPRGLTWDPDLRVLWLVDTESRTLIEVDPSNGATGRSLDLPVMKGPSGVALRHGRFYMADLEAGEVVVVSYGTGELRERWHVGRGVCGVEWWDRDLWVAEEGGSRLVRLDPTRGFPAHSEPLPAPLKGRRLMGLTVDGEAFWIGDDSHGQVLRLRPEGALPPGSGGRRSN